MRGMLERAAAALVALACPSWERSAMCYSPTHMVSVGVRELRQNLSRYLDRVKAGEALDVTEHGRLVARLSPAGDPSDAYADAASSFGATIPTARLEDVIARLPPRGAPAGTADAILAEGRRHRA
jgi:prevent-host-death family protein